MILSRSVVRTKGRDGRAGIINLSGRVGYDPMQAEQLYQISLIRTGRLRQNPHVMEQAWPIVNHIAGDLKTTPRVSLSEIWYYTKSL